MERKDVMRARQKLPGESLKLPVFRERAGAVVGCGGGDQVKAGQDEEEQAGGDPEGAGVLVVGGVVQAGVAAGGREVVDAKACPDCQRAGRVVWPEGQGPAAGGLVSHREVAVVVGAVVLVGADGGYRAGGGQVAVRASQMVNRA
jgi:hypothetical protein